MALTAGARPCYLTDMFYKLDGRTPVPCTAEELGAWMQDADRTVALDTVDDWTISTVFLGIDHEWSDDAPPLLFETMVFEGDSTTGVVWRYTTWEEAERGHRNVVADVRRKLIKTV